MAAIIRSVNSSRWDVAEANIMKQARARTYSSQPVVRACDPPGCAQTGAIVARSVGRCFVRGILVPLEIHLLHEYSKVKKYIVA